MTRAHSRYNPLPRASSHATATLATGAPIKAVSRRLGHADVVITLRVNAHRLPDDDANLASQVWSRFRATTEAEWMYCGNTPAPNEMREAHEPLGFLGLS